MGTRWWVQGKASPELVALQADPDQVLAGAGSVARERVGRKRFYRVDGSPALYVKIFNAPSGLARFETWLGPSRARREALVATLVRAAGFDAVVPVAVAEERTIFGLLRRGIVVTEERSARDLRSLLLDPSTDRRLRRGLVESFGALNRALHDAGVDQDDTSPNNFLVDASERWALIDFERCSVSKKLGKRRWKLIAKLHRHDLGVSATDRLRFLRAYLGDEDGRAERRRAFERICEALAEVRRNDASRAAAGAFQQGRNVAREGNSWFVRGRENGRAIRIDLDPQEARRLWVLAHQLERLRLPALRPLRLSVQGLELEAPRTDEAPTRGAIQRARRTLERHGVLRADPQWALHDGKALLTNLDAYELRL